MPMGRVPGAFLPDRDRPGRERATHIREFLEWLEEEVSKTRAGLLSVGAG